MKLYEEVIDFIASGTTPTSVVEFHPSALAKNRMLELLAKEKEEKISSEEKEELDHYIHLEHIMRLAKAKARQYIKK